MYPLKAQSVEQIIALRHLRYLCLIKVVTKKKFQQCDVAKQSTIQIKFLVATSTKSIEELSFRPDD